MKSRSALLIKGADNGAVSGHAGEVRMSVCVAGLERSELLAH
jgi:hypothetical protein